MRSAEGRDFQFVGTAQCSAQVLLEISEFLDTQDTSHPFQLPQWSGSGAHLAWLRHEGRIRWFAQCGVLYPAGRFLRSIRALTVNRGPVCDDLELMETGLQHLVAEGRKQGLAYIDIAPEWTGAFAESAAPLLARNGWQALPRTRSSLHLDLRPALESLPASFRKTTRYEIHRAESQGVEVTLGHDEHAWQDFLQLYAEMAAQKKFMAEDLGQLLRVLRWLEEEKDRGGLLVARKDGKLMGGIVIVRCGACCWYVLGATRKGGKFSAGHLLQWRAIRWAKEKGCLEYDLGGFREDANSGPALFKRGFCNKIVHFFPPHRYIVSRYRHRLADLVSTLRGAARILPSRASGRFPH
jgi:hypothetical protein